MVKIELNRRSTKLKSARLNLNYINIVCLAKKYFLCRNINISYGNKENNSVRRRIA